MGLSGAGVGVVQDCEQAQLHQAVTAQAVPGFQEWGRGMPSCHSVHTLTHTQSHTHNHTHTISHTQSLTQSHTHSHSHTHNHTLVHLCTQSHTHPPTHTQSHTLTTHTVHGGRWRGTEAAMVRPCSESVGSALNIGRRVAGVCSWQPGSDICTHSLALDIRGRKTCGVR